MADEEEKNEAEEGAAEEEVKPSGKKKGLLLGGGAISLIATGAVVAMLAAPGGEERPKFDGPFVMPLAAEGTSIQVNLKGDQARRYLVMDLQVEYDAYKETYGQERIVDPLYLARLQDELLTLCAQKTSEEVLERGSQEIFLEELHATVEPLLFPVHIGNTKVPTAADEASGLRPGHSFFLATMRDPISDGKITLNAAAKTLRLGEGEEFEYLGHEENLALKDEQGRVVYVDVTHVKEEFVGEIPVGVNGRLRNVYKIKFIIQ